MGDPVRLYFGERLWDDACELAKHSLRLRLYVDGMYKARDRFRPAIGPDGLKTTCHYVGPGNRDLLRRLVTDTRLRLGLPVEPWVDWPFDRDPVNEDEAIRYLQRPELFDTENYEAMRAHAQREGCCDDVLQLTDRVISRAEQLHIPMFAEVLFRSRAEADRLFVTGQTEIRAVDDPFCRGRAIKFGHAAQTWLPPACAEWFRQLVRHCADELRVNVGFAECVFTVFVADVDGVICDPADPLPLSGGQSEADALLAFYSGASSSVPWDCAQTRAEQSGRSIQEEIDGMVEDSDPGGSGPRGRSLSRTEKSALAMLGLRKDSRH